jgi:membrane-bound metal-dependent hydrolase YbcI (DUF457 family)
MGASIGVLCMPRRWRWEGKAALLAGFAFLANVPDFRFHPRYPVRHSLFVNLALLAGPVLVLALWPRLRRAAGGWRVIAAGAAAWLSHLLLDTFYCHGAGLGVFWPISTARINLAMPWFDTLKYGWVATARTARILATEAAFYGAILGACLLLRRGLSRRAGRLGAVEDRKSKP